MTHPQVSDPIYSPRYVFITKSLKFWGIYENLAKNWYRFYPFKSPGAAQMNLYSFKFSPFLENDKFSKGKGKEEGGGATRNFLFQNDPFFAIFGGALKRANMVNFLFYNITKNKTCPLQLHQNELIRMFQNETQKNPLQSLPYSKKNHKLTKKTKKLKLSIHLLQNQTQNQKFLQLLQIIEHFKKLYSKKTVKIKINFKAYSKHHFDGAVVKIFVTQENLHFLATFSSIPPYEKFPNQISKQFDVAFLPKTNIKNKLKREKLGATIFNETIIKKTKQTPLKIIPIRIIAQKLDVELFVKIKITIDFLNIQKNPNQDST
eukprot:TRINITY_DN11606_c0_g3_i1.p1 TRINITY_DN11606_c0_g3~~TRINITY_DN11606_c0_g3_i1.p1  ORF type:complete len:318 (+),score=13.63 TRINITY_DN11606_c0_g3_i1:413-1366(+)